MTHYELCKATAERAIKGSACWVVLYEYQHMTGNEQPDVLVYTNRETSLYEIKVDRADFIRDKDKEARKKWKPKLGLYQMHSKDELRVKAMAPELYYIEHPHLGTHRTYVCPWGLIQPEEIPEGWGLLWYKDGRFYHKKNGTKFRPNMKAERNLLAHALRRYASGNDTGIMVKTYEV